MESGPPHEALFLVLAYLPLYELLSMTQVCRSLRDATSTDILIWLDIIVQKPLHVRISDDILIQVTSKAQGRLRSLVLLYCDKITNNGLQRVVERNPLISKLYIPGCTSITPEGVLTAVQTLTTQNHHLTSLKIAGIYHPNQQILTTLQSYLPPATVTQRTSPPPKYYHKRISPSSGIILHDSQTTSNIDVKVCPKCGEVTMVFDCPRETCKARIERYECRGCYYCITRCEECGMCVPDEEQGEVICTDTVCLECWLQLPKCSYCNKPYCRKHAEIVPSSSTGFVCDDCQTRYTAVD